MDGFFLKLLDFLTIAQFSQALLLIFILLVMDKNKKANIFFAAFLFILSTNFFSFFLFKYKIKILSTVFASLSLPGISIIGVFLYFYALSITGLLEKFKPRHLLHFTIYFMSLLFFLTVIHKTSGEPEPPVSIKNAIFIMMTIGLVNSILYIFYTMTILHRYYHKIENYYSDLEMMNLGWLGRIIPLSFLTLIIWCIGFWFAYLGIIPKSHIVIGFTIVMLTIIIFVTAYKIINQPEIFRQNIEMVHETEDPEDSAGTEKYARQSIDDRMQDEYLEKLNFYMYEQKPYLDENITIKDLAEELEIPSHHLSIVINNRLNKNFYTFINEYRIKESQQILKDPGNSDASILSIAFKSGFNSKSTFNTTFKKITGLTPTEYRESAIPKSMLAS